jgi:ABC-type maltose transport system permease subunit
MLDNTTRLISTITIWTAFTIVITFGICRMNFHGLTGLIAFLFIIAMLCLAAVKATALVWKGHCNTNPNAQSNSQSPQ